MKEEVDVCYFIRSANNMDKSDKSLLDRLQQIVQIITLTMTIIGLVKKFMDWNNERA